ncbi:hypothetical protein DPMN_084498 [Dreissena polymorpha]|uniref:Uncharacterized protein n=1 Tax=Dreissena polymorpha TaxID=45954 RepID=A0A9D4BKX8_DREPO|nr:hypothetical protein DPMN_084498 [Dreissena polymorpha]
MMKGEIRSWHDWGMHTIYQLQMNYIIKRAVLIFELDDRHPSANKLNLKFPLSLRKGVQRIKDRVKHF